MVYMFGKDPWQSYQSPFMLFSFCFYYTFLMSSLLVLETKWWWNISLLIMLGCLILRTPNSSRVKALLVFECPETKTWGGPSPPAPAWSAWPRWSCPRPRWSRWSSWRAWPSSSSGPPQTSACPASPRGFQKSQRVYPTLYFSDPR